MKWPWSHDEDGAVPEGTKFLMLEGPPPSVGRRVRAAYHVSLPAVRKELRDVRDFHAAIVSALEAIQTALDAGKGSVELHPVGRRQDLISALRDLGFRVVDGLREITISWDQRSW